MPKVEIDEAELTALRGATALLDELQNNPKTRRPFQRAVKEIRPNAITDEDRLKEAPEMQELATLTAEVKGLKESLQQREQDAETNAAFSRLAADGYTDEGIGKIKQLMVDRKIADPEAAAALWDKQNPPKDLPQSGLFNTTSFGFGRKTDQVDTKLLWEDEDAYADQEFARVMNGQA